MIRSLVFAIVILTSINCLAQSRTSSPYSFFGLGQQTFNGTIENRSMGGMRTFVDSVHINLRNPAAYGNLRVTTYAIGAVHSKTWASTETESDSYDATTIEYVSIGIPLGKKAAFGFGLVPFSSVGYEIGNVTETLYSRYTGTGSIARAYLGLGYKITPALSIGGEFRYNFGQETNSSSVGLSTVQFGRNETNETDFSGASVNLGLHYQKMITNQLELQASAVYSPESKLNAKNKRVVSAFTLLGNLTENIFNSRAAEFDEQNLRLPSALTFGLTIGEPLEWNLGAEFSTRGSSALTSRSFAPETTTFKDAVSYRVGGFYIPNYNSITSYWDRIVFRGGIRYEELGLEVSGDGINSSDINEFGISFGLGLPIGRRTGFSNANLGFEFGQRGTKNSGLIEETFFNLSIGLSLNDTWFVKRKYN
jgi:long-subunit fatty acid transport protein